MILDFDQPLGPQLKLVPERLKQTQNLCNGENNKIISKI